jgi:hypothetical protein
VQRIIKAYDEFNGNPPGSNRGSGGNFRGHKH